MIRTEITITNQLGFHARPASKFVQIASSGKSEVFVLKNGNRVNGHSILGVMLLEAVQGSKLTIEVNGEDEEEVLFKLVELVNSKFGED